MPYKYLDILSTAGVRDAQTENGAREQWAGFTGERVFDRFDENAAAFIAARDSFYIASLSSNGWPYVQHRGGPIGFIKVLDDKTLGFADYSGNRQYITMGNVKTENRVALFMVDYPRRKRLKMMAYLTVRGLEDDPNLTGAILDNDYPGKVERLITLTLEAYDWNCPQHIVPRFTKDMVDQAAKPLQDEIARLSTENEALKAQLAAIKRD